MSTRLLIAAFYDYETDPRYLNTPATSTIPLPTRESILQSRKRPHTPDEGTSKIQKSELFSPNQSVSYVLKSPSQQQLQRQQEQFDREFNHNEYATAETEGQYEEYDEPIVVAVHEQFVRFTWLESTSTTPINFNYTQTFEFNQELVICADMIPNLIQKRLFLSQIPSQQLKQIKIDLNPYSKVLTKRFHHAPAVKYAELDHYFGLTAQTLLTRPSYSHSGQPKKMLDLSFGMGGALEYFVYRDARIECFAVVSTSHFKGYEFTRSSLYQQMKTLKIKMVLSCFQSIEEQITWTLAESRGGVDLVVADGYGSEPASKMRQIFYQLTVALNTLTPDGTLILQLGDLFDPFNVDILFILYRAFTKITVAKPVTLDPASNEKIVICVGFKHETEDGFISGEYAQIKTSLRCKLIEAVEDDVNFCEWLQDMNMRFYMKEYQSMANVECMANGEKRRGFIDYEGTKQQCFKDWQL